jgi:hypothetical protein
MGRKRILKKKELLEAIQGSRGFISTIAARLHCEWHTVDNAIKLYPECMQALADENETTLDFVEGKAIQRINDGDGAMIRFYLATKGKKRGFTYDEKLEVDEATEDNELAIEIVDGADED